jgi:pSer/pThr/pTyr-binding forkhead associated (FHA) protein
VGRSGSRFGVALAPPAGILKKTNICADCLDGHGMEVNLVVQNGPSRTRKIQVRNSEALVGRRRGCQVRIPSADVSRSHCRLSVQDGYVTVEDLDSFNGTFLNGDRVSSVQPVRPGDRLEVGPVAFVVEYELTKTALRALNQRFPARVSGSAADQEAVPAIVEEDDQPIGLSPIDEEEGLAQPIILPENEMLEEAQATGPEEVTVDFDDNAPWQLPDPDQLRDILKQMDKPKGRP